MFIQKIKNWLMPGAESFGSFTEDRMVFMGGNKPGNKPGIQATPEFKTHLQLKKTAYQNAKTPEAKLKLLNNDIARLKRFVTHLEESNVSKAKKRGEMLKKFDNIIKKLETARDKYQASKDKITKETLEGLAFVNAGLNKFNKEFNGANAAWVDPGPKPVVNPTKKKTVVPAGKPVDVKGKKLNPTATVTPPAVAPKTTSKVTPPVNNNTNTLPDGTENATSNIASKQNDAVKAVADLVDGERFDSKGEKALSKLFASIRAAKGNGRILLPDFHVSAGKEVDDKGYETKKIIKRKDTMPYNATIEKSTKGSYFKIVIQPKPGFKYSGSREFYLVEKKRTVKVTEKGKDGKDKIVEKEVIQVALRSQAEIEAGKVKFDSKEKKEKPISNKEKLANLLAIIDREGPNAFKQYTRGKIDRNTGRPSGPAELKNLMNEVCGNSVGNNEIIKLPHGYSIFMPKWRYKTSDKAERIILKGAEVVGMQMPGGHLKYAPVKQNDGSGDVARRDAETMKSRAFLPSILNTMKLRGEGEFMRPYFASVEDFNNIKTVLNDFANNSPSDQGTINYGGGKTVHYDRSVDGNMTFTMRFKVPNAGEFTMYYDTAYPNDFGLPNEEGDYDGDYTDEDSKFLPTLEEEDYMNAEKEKNQMEGKINKLNDNFKNLLKEAHDKYKGTFNKAVKYNVKLKIYNDAVKFNKELVSKKALINDRAKQSLKKIGENRGRIISTMKKNMGKTATILKSDDGFYDTWTSVAKKTKINDVVQNPDKYTLSRGKFVLKIKKNIKMSSSERKLVKKMKIQKLLQLNNGPLKDKALQVVITTSDGKKVFGTRYPKEDTVYTGNPRKEKNRMKFKAGDTISVSLFTDKDIRAQQKELNQINKKITKIKKTIDKGNSTKKMDDEFWALSNKQQDLEDRIASAKV